MNERTGAVPASRAGVYGARGNTRGGRDADKLPHVGVSGVSVEAGQFGEADDGIRVLDAKAILFHHRHTTAWGELRAQGCPICELGMAGAAKTVEEPQISEDGGVVQDRGGDEAGATALTPDLGVDAEFEEVAGYPGWYRRKRERVS